MSEIFKKCSVLETDKGFLIGLGRFLTFNQATSLAHAILAHVQQEQDKRAAEKAKADFSVNRKGFHMDEAVKELEGAALAVLYGVRPYQKGTTADRSESIIADWRIKQLADAIKRTKALEANKDKP